jgi:hypothetical protein
VIVDVVDIVGEKNDSLLLLYYNVANQWQIKHPKWFTRIIQNKRSVSLNRVTYMTKYGHIIESSVSRDRDGVLMVYYTI